MYEVIPFSLNDEDAETPEVVGCIDGCFFVIFLALFGSTVLVVILDLIGVFK